MRYIFLQDKLDFLLEKTDALEEQMDSLSSSCLSWKVGLDLSYFPNYDIIFINY
jgi:hypothetical protein